MKTFNNASLVGALALAASITAANAGPVAQPAGSEKCFGVAKAAKNDCAAGVRSCAGHATKDGDKSAYVYLPAGACAKLVGSSLTAAK
jgi:uncharacterized membrane protein